MKLNDSKKIWHDAVEQIKPTYTVMAFSGGNDSLATYYAAKNLQISIDALLHVNTQTGIQEVSEYVRDFAEREGCTYIEADAGTAYEDYVLRKGFFGRGNTAHTYAYHVLKAGPLRKALSQHFRHGKQGVRIALLNGARTEESKRRAKGKPDAINKDPSGENYWVSLIHTWTKAERDDFLDAIPDLYRNPVTKNLCRSGECFCGTMQTKAEIAEAEFYYPEWSKKMRNLESRVLEQGFTWGWGDDVNDIKAQLDDGAQMLFEDFAPMCVDCQNNNAEELIK